MAKAATSKRNTEARPALGPGLHAGTIELRSGRSYRVRTTAGARLRAALGDGVDPGLADECLRASRLVILCDTERGPTIVGALQTTRSIVHEPDGTLAIEGKTIRLRAEKSLRIEAGPVSLTLDAAGTARAEGDRMVIDMSSNVRVLSALVELP